MPANPEQFALVRPVLAPRRSTLPTQATIEQLVTPGACLASGKPPNTPWSPFATGTPRQSTQSKAIWLPQRAGNPASSRNQENGGHKHPAELCPCQRSGPDAPVSAATYPAIPVIRLSSMPLCPALQPFANLNYSLFTSENP